ncbi:unnamed protein product [Soboliphyme baturini]|uniref:Uncharacterized protein n=1 Tax=Soboliphyme baturini TaxID=241478 RepID=A0A183IRX7_9BILA|nr:unnamed protein product [Soboliphyme baturini]
MAEAKNETFVKCAELPVVFLSKPGGRTGREAAVSSSSEGCSAVNHAGDTRCAMPMPRPRDGLSCYFRDFSVRLLPMGVLAWTTIQAPDTKRTVHSGRASARMLCVDKSTKHVLVVGTLFWGGGERANDSGSLPVLRCGQSTTDNRFAEAPVIFRPHFL